MNLQYAKGLVINKFVLLRIVNIAVYSITSEPEINKTVLRHNGSVCNLLYA